MIYPLYETVRWSTRPLAWTLDTGQRLARDDRNPWRDTLAMRALATAWELPARALKSYGKPDYRVSEPLGDLDLTIQPEVVVSRPFADLLRFNASGDEQRPKVLIAAALSGHHATLLRDTVATFLQDFDTYITDWKDAREVPLAAGDFGFDDYVDYLVDFLEVLGPGTHLVATCQAAPAAMVATALMVNADKRFRPASLTLMGGPIDTRVSPTFMSTMTKVIPLWLFEKNNIHKVPGGNAGKGRRVYPGFFQLAGFLAANPKPHLKQYRRFVTNSLKGDDTSLDGFRDFYDEYFATLDMTESFYIETLRKVFFEHHIPRGIIEHRGERVDFSAVRDLRVLTVEGADDNFCPPGQTEAAHEVFSALSGDLKKNHVQSGVGHYGVFSGSRFREEIYPVIREFCVGS